MKISNESRAVKYKRTFFLVSIGISIGALVLSLLDYDIYALGCVGLFSLWYLYFHVADYHYIEYSDEDHKILLRYYKVIGFGSKAYHSIEFPQQILQNAHFDHSLFGKLSDLTFIIRTKRGIAEYPSVSLTALSLDDRTQIQENLNQILKH